MNYYWYNETNKNLDNDTRAALNYQFQKSIFLEALKKQSEYEKVKREIVEEVLSRIAIDADTTDAIKKIKELKHELDNLTK